jgi:trehalose 6-phosphate synthase/phosphatase
MGIDASAWAERSTRDDVVRLTHRLRDEAGGRRLLVGVDRLDYTKGIPRRIAAVERLFVTGLTRPDDVRFLQIAVPSRGNVGSYLAIRRRTDELVGHINGLYSTFGAVPIHNAYRAAFPAELAALYRAADVMLVTPLIDGMNLVAKEFVASRTDHDGVLVLSEFAGAAEQLDGAILVNPYDLDAVARAIARALQMPQAERRARMRRLRAQVITWDVNRWVSSFLHDLGAAASVRAHQPESEPQVRGREPSLMGRR